MEKISDRILKIIERESISVRSFEVSIGVSNGVIAKSISKGTDISSSTLSKIFEHFPKYSPAWILTGNGGMIVSNLSKSVAGEPTVPYGKQPKPYPTKGSSPDPDTSCADCLYKDELIKELRRNILVLEENAELLRQLMREKNSK